MNVKGHVLGRVPSGRRYKGELVTRTKRGAVYLKKSKKRKRKRYLTKKERSKIN